MELQGCPRCGSYENWEVLGLEGEEFRDGVRLYRYSTVCTQCGRPSKFLTENPDAVPERVRIRDELFKPEKKFDSGKAWSSDEIGLDITKVKPRLPTGKDV